MPAGTASSARLTESFASPQVLQRISAASRSETTRIDPEQAGGADEQTGDDDARRRTGVAEHVEEGAADVEIVRAAAHEAERGAEVDDDTDGRHDRHDAARDRRGMAESVHRLDDDRADGDEQDARVGDRREDGEAAHAVGAARRRAAPREHGAGPGEDEREHVAEVVAGVGDQRERVRAKPERRSRRRTNATLSPTPMAKARSKLAGACEWPAWSCPWSCP